MASNTYQIHTVGFVRSVLQRTEDAPKQGDEGAPDAWIELSEEMLEGLDGIVAGDQLIILTWLHLGNRSVLKVHPRGDVNQPLKGVFATRSPSRPNPIGLHRVSVLEIDPARGVRVAAIEAFDGTPVVDIKPALS